MAPLSGKQQREYLKFQNKEARETSKMEVDEMRKQQLHELKLQEAAAKAKQGLGHKEQVNNAKLKDMGIPPARMNKQKLGIPTQNPLAGTGMFKQGQRSLAQAPIFQAQGTDTVPAMLTPGEAVIPRAAAQDPKNKKAIKRMVQEGRRANMRDGAVDVRYSDAPGQAKYHADGSYGITANPQEYLEDGTGQGLAPSGMRHGSMQPKGKGYFGVLSRPNDDSSSTELSSEFTFKNKKVEYPLIVPTLSKGELNHLLSGEEPTNKIYDKAESWAKSRIKKGLSPFSGNNELRIPTPKYMDGTSGVPSLAYIQTYPDHRSCMVQWMYLTLVVVLLLRLIIITVHMV